MTTLSIVRRSCRLSAHSLPVALAAAWLAAGAGLAQAGDPADAYPAACASRDLKLVSLLDLHGHMEFVSPDVLSDAYLEILQARKACAAGHVAEAVGIYERILPGLYEAAGEDGEIGEMHAAR